MDENKVWRRFNEAVRARNQAEGEHMYATAQFYQGCLRTWLEVMEIMKEEE